MADMQQMSIFDFLEEEKSEPEIMLTEGQAVYLVNKGDVVKATVLKENWICGENNRGYRLAVDTGGYSCTWNEKILSKDVFTDYSEAKQKADLFLQSHDVILAENISPLSIKAFQYVRDVDNRTMTAFIADLGNEVYYIKEFMTYHHICKGEKALKGFMKQDEFKHNDVKEVENYKPNFKNMYKTSKPSNWDYAEAGYTYSVG